MIYYKTLTEEKSVALLEATEYIKKQKPESVVEITKNEYDILIRKITVDGIKRYYNNSEIVLKDVEEMLSDGRITQEEYDEIVGGAV